MNLAIFGARSDSLGWEVGEAAEGLAEATVRTYGISGEEDVKYDCESNDVEWSYDLAEFAPDAVLVTTGVNLPVPFVESGHSKWKASMWQSFSVNVMGPLDVLRECSGIPSVQQFVAISSNSAHIARRGSSPYCSSKSALSMALRCAARERVVPLIYGYEFGLLANTPMTQASAEQFSGPLSRMVGAENGLSPHQVARLMVTVLVAPTHALNGVMLRLDAGEQ